MPSSDFSTMFGFGVPNHRNGQDLKAKFERFGASKGGLQPPSMGSQAGGQPAPQPKPRYKLRQVDTEEPKPEDPLEEAYGRWQKSPGGSTLNEAINAAGDILDRAATTYAGKNSPLIRSRARIMAAKAIESYDPSRGAALKSWLMTNLQGLSRYKQQLTPMAAPERVRQELAYLKRMQQELGDELGREPTENELQDYSHLSRKRLQHLRNFDKAVVTEGQLVDDEGEPYLPGVVRHDVNDMWAQYVYADLDPVNQKVYDMILGRNGQKPHSVNDVARKLGISAAAVSQRTKRIADMLEEGQRVLK